MERLDTDAIARDEETPRPRVPDGQPEHASKPAHRRRAPLFVGMHDRFGVGGGIEAMACRFQLATKLAKVVDLPVEDDPHRLVFVVDRLMAGREVDDTQAAHAERHAITHQHTFIVGTTMADHVAHAVNEITAVVRPERIGDRRRFDETGNPAHLDPPSEGGSHEPPPVNPSVATQDGTRLAPDVLDLISSSPTTRGCRREPTKLNR